MHLMYILINRIKLKKDLLKFLLENHEKKSQNILKILNSQWYLSLSQVPFLELNSLWGLTDLFHFCCIIVCLIDISTPKESGSNPKEAQKCSIPFWIFLGHIISSVHQPRWTSVISSRIKFFGKARTKRWEWPLIKNYFCYFLSIMNRLTQPI